MPLTDYDWEADALGSWAVAIAGMKRRAAAGEDVASLPFFRSMWEDGR